MRGETIRRQSRKRKRLQRRTFIARALMSTHYSGVDNAVAEVIDVASATTADDQGNWRALLDAHGAYTA